MLISEGVPRIQELLVLLVTFDLGVLVLGKDPARDARERSACPQHIQRFYVSKTRLRREMEQSAWTT
jgi:hypothetical protein